MKLRSALAVTALTLLSLAAPGLRAGEGAALAIGLNSVSPAHYGGWSGPLTACEFDATDMAEIAKSQGFTSQVLLTKSATRQAVIDALTALAGTLKAGDTLILSYSGHGGSTPDQNGDEADAKDETWCLYDGQLLDDELAALWPKFKEGVEICVYSDSCHSGTVTKYAQYLAALDAFPGAASDFTSLTSLRKSLTSGKKAEPQPVETMLFRAMPDAVAQATFTQNRAFYEGLETGLAKECESKTHITASVLLISGCQDNQLSADGPFNGLFTAKLKLIWNKAGFKGSHPEFQHAILMEMPSNQSPNYYVIGKANAAFEAERPWTK